MIKKISHAAFAKVQRAGSDPVVFTIFLFCLVAVAEHYVRQDILLTRVSVDRPVVTEYKSPQMSPQMSVVLMKLARSDWKYETSSFDTFRPSDPLALVASTLKLQMPYSSQHLKLWDLLDESYVEGPDPLAPRIATVLVTSIYFSEPINQEGFCDYVESRVMPAFDMLKQRKDYNGARRLIADANNWIDAYKPKPSLAGESPRLQSDINYFRKLDAVLFDPGLLVKHPAESGTLIEYLKGGTAGPPGVADFLRTRDDTELQSWGLYLQGAAALQKLDYLQAGARFQDAAQKTGNPKLGDLATLGFVRSIFWATIAGQVDPVHATAAIEQERPHFRSARYSNDVTYYLEQLSKAGTASSTSSPAVAHESGIGAEQ